jgi:polysaccharide pyruvyl transferase CsaB
MQYFLIGYYGYLNTGDDICLQKTKELIKQQDATATFLILGSKTNYINRVHIFKVIAAIMKSQKVVLGGGSLCQNVSSSMSLYYYLSLILIARICNKPIYALAQGIGPIQGRFHNWISKWVFTYIKTISLRDSIYASFFKTKLPILSSDLAFHNANQHEYSGNSTRIGLNLCNLKYLNVTQKISSYLTSKEFDVQKLSFCKTVDSVILNKLDTNSKSIHIIESENYYEKSKVSYKIIITMRYHSCVWAALQGIPFLALAYDEKVALIAKQLKQPCIELYNNEFSIDKFSSLFTDLTDNPLIYQKHLSESCKQLIDISKLNKKVLSL